MASQPSPREWFMGIFEPAYLLLFGYYHMLLYALSAIFLQGDYGLLFNISRLRDESFGRRWLALNRPAPASQTGASALVRERFRKLFTYARGWVLEIGPGSGMQVPFFGLEAPNIEAIYGTEPVASLHPMLREAARKHGLGRKYEILQCGIEPDEIVPALARAGLLPVGAEQGKGVGDGIFDCVFSLRVLCSVADQKSGVDMLYKLLKPGGKLVFYEHLRNDTSVIADLAQKVYMFFGWSFVWGDCSMRNSTLDVLKDAAREDGGWAEEDIDILNSWGCIPYGIGILTKKGFKRS